MKSKLRGLYQGAWLVALAVRAQAASPGPSPVLVFQSIAQLASSAAQEAKDATQGLRDDRGGVFYTQDRFSAIRDDLNQIGDALTSLDANGAALTASEKEAVQQCRLLLERDRVVSEKAVRAFHDSGRWQGKEIVQASKQISAAMHKTVRSEKAKKT